MSETRTLERSAAGIHVHAYNVTVLILADELCKDSEICERSLRVGYSHSAMLFEWSDFLCRGRIEPSRRTILKDRQAINESSGEQRVEQR